MLLNGQHYRHIQKNSDVLVVSYAPVEVPLGQLPHYKRLAPLEIDRLAINPATDNFYQDCIDEVYKLIENTTHKYKIVIHYGYSAGAYAALRFGAADPAATAIFALGPHINLKQPNTRSALLVGKFSSRESDWNLIDAINNTFCPNVYMLYSCCDLMDGIQVEDSKKIYNKNVKNIYYNLPHDLPGVNQPFEIIANFLASGKHITLAEAYLASPQAQQDSILSYKMYCDLISGEDNFENTVLTDRVYSGCGILPYMQARILHRRNKYHESFLKYNEAILIMRDNKCHLGEVYFCIANNLLDLQMDEFAFGAYRESMRLNSRHVDLHRVYTREAFRRGRLDEIRFVMRQHKKAYGRTPSLAAMEGELGDYPFFDDQDIT